MKVLVLGADGMLGHRMTRVLAEDFEVLGTVRSTPPARWARLCRGVALREGVGLEDVPAVVADFTPAAVVNCVGVVKQRSTASFWGVNAEFPWVLAGLGPRLVHFSTDCVFSGRRGLYRQDETPDPVDEYGRSKLAGEVDRPGCLTLRTSIVGWELKEYRGLLEWFAAQRGGTVKGFRRAVFSGLSTEALARLTARLLRSDLSGLWQVAAAPLDKFTLLTRLRDELGWAVEIVPDDDFACDRSLDGTPFQAAAGWRPPSWDEMLRDLAAQRADYE